MSELLRFFKDMRDNGYGLAEIAAQLGTSAIAEPVAGFAAMYDPAHGADAIREGMTYTPRTQEAQEYSQSVGNAAKTAIKPAMPIIDTWKKGVDIAGQYSPVVGAGLRTVPTAIGIAMGAKPALQAGRQVSKGLESMQGRMIANANAPRTLNTGFRGQRGAINPSDFNLVTNPDGTVTMYHGTTKEAAQKIIQERKLLSAGEPDVYMTTDPMAGYGDGTTVKFNIDPKHINLDDEFPSGRVDFRMPAAKGWRIQNPEINTPKRPLTEFEQAHLTAQRGAIGTETPKIKQISDNWESQGVRNSVSENGNRVMLSQVIVPKELRNQGIGSKYMRELIDYADSVGKRVELSPSADFGGNKNKLKEFYSRFGFVENKGRNKDFEISESMYRPSRPIAPQRPLTEFEQAHLTAQSAKLAPTTALGAYMYNEKRKKSQGNQ